MLAWKSPNLRPGFHVLKTDRATLQGLLQTDLAKRQSLHNLLRGGRIRAAYHGLRRARNCVPEDLPGGTKGRAKHAFRRLSRISKYAALRDAFYQSPTSSSWDICAIHDDHCKSLR